MEQTFTNPYQLILVLIAIIASLIVFGQLVLRRDTNTWATALLATFMLFNALMNAVFLLVDTGLILKYWYLYRITAPLNYIMGAMMFFYIRALVNDDRGPKLMDWLHGLPMVFAAVNYLPFYLSSADEKREKLDAVVNNYAEYVQGQDGFFPESVMIVLRIATLLVYIPFYFQLAHSHHTSMDQSSVFNKRVDRWLWILATTITFYFLAVCVFLLTQLLPESLIYQPNYLAFLGFLDRFVELFWTSSFVFISVYLALVPSVGIGQFFEKEQQFGSGEYNDANTLGKSPENKASQHPDLLVLTQAFEDQSFWKDSAASLKSLAHQLGFSQRKTSYLVNKFLGGNFNQVVNRYRIEHAKELIAQGFLSKHSVEGLWKECGFSNHTTFYQGFKKHTGKTPSEYEKQVLGLV